MRPYAGIDLGATHVRAMVGDEGGTEVASVKRSTPDGPDGETVTEAVCQTLAGACAEAGIGPADLRGVGIGSMGPLDRAAGAVDNPVNLPESVDRIPLTDPIVDLVGTDRVVLRNDTDAGVVGQRFYGPGTPEHVVYVTISSGIGAGAVVDGSLLLARGGNAGEVGHVTVDPEGTMTCRCGVPGHWEAYCAGHNLPRYARTLYESGDWTTSLPISRPAFDASTLYDHAGEDEFADAVIERVTRYNAIGMADLVHTFAPSVVYVGGAVALNNPELVIDPLRDRVPERVYVPAPEIERTTLGEDVVLKGALACVLPDPTD